MAVPYYQDEQLLLAARLYYVDGLVQAEVARLCNVSQAKVSRLLTQARERGVVRISVPEYQSRDHDAEARLKRELGLAQAVVVKTAPGADVRDTRKAVGYFAAPVVSEWPRPGTVLATAGGRAMQKLVARMRPAGGPPPGGLTVVQAMGHIDPQVGPYDAVEIGRGLAQRWGGPLLMLNAPAILPDPETRDRLLALDSVRSVKDRLRRADLALVGVGTPSDSVFVERGAIGKKDLRTLVDAGAVGEICGRYFDARGAECDSPLRDRVIGIDLADLRRIRQVVAVVAGGGRAAAVRAAARGGLVKTLVIDLPAARELLGDDPAGEQREEG